MGIGSGVQIDCFGRCSRLGLGEARAFGLEGDAVADILGGGVCGGGQVNCAVADWMEACSGKMSQEFGGVHLVDYWLKARPRW